MDDKHKNPNIYFFVTLYPYGALTSSKKLEKLLNGLKDTLRRTNGLTDRMIQMIT